MGFGGNRLFFDSLATIYEKGECKAISNYYSLRDIEMVYGTVDLNIIRMAKMN